VVGIASKTVEAEPPFIITVRAGQRGPAQLQFYKYPSREITPAQVQLANDVADAYLRPKGGSRDEQKDEAGED